MCVCLWPVCLHILLHACLFLLCKRNTEISIVYMCKKVEGERGREREKGEGERKTGTETQRETQ